MPDVAGFDNEDDWMAACVPERIDEGEEQEQAVAVCLNIWREREGKTMDTTATDEAVTGSTMPTNNALKAIKRTPYELTVGNYIVLFGGRDLEGVGSASVNVDGSRGEFFTADTVLESAATKAGLFDVDWEHAQGEAGNDVLGVVDWKTARIDDRGVFVERVLSRRNQYVQWLEELGWFDDGTLGTSSEADPAGVQKAADGRITRWPLVRDTITVQPMEPRMIAENQLQALKALGLVPASDDTADDPEPEASPEDAQASADAVKARLRLELDLLTLEDQ
jgi:hypothetical protein